VTGSRRTTGFAVLVSPTWLVLGVFFLVPLLLVLLISFSRTNAFGGPELPSGLSALWDHIRSGEFLAHYARTLHNPYLRDLWRSLWMAVLTTLLAALIGYPAAYYIAVVAKRRWRNLLLVGVIVPFWTSFVIRTYAWVLLLRDRGLINNLLVGLGLIDRPLDLMYTELAVMIGLVYGELPFMILPLYASLEKLDRSLLDAASDLGAGGWSAFRRVTLPLSAPGLAAGVVLVFIPSLGQFVVSDLLGGGRSDLVGNVIQREFTGAAGPPDRPFGAALAFELTAGVLLLLFLYARRARRGAGEVLL
jgi:spermidine/putrescine transport system permease protein